MCIRDSRDADLRGADLSECKLDGADLTRAWYDQWTTWPDDFDEALLSSMLPRSEVMSDLDHELVELDDLLAQVVDLR